MSKNFKNGEKAIFFDGRAFLSTEVEIISKREDLGEVYTFKNRPDRPDISTSIGAYLYSIDEDGIKKLLDDVECEILSLKRLRKRIENNYLDLE